MIQSDRFFYEANLERATAYRAYRSPLWPPAREHRLIALDIARAAPALPDAARAELETLRALIEAEWERIKVQGSPGRTRLHQAGPVAAAMRRLAALLPGEVDRRALSLRADAVEVGYDEAGLAALARLGEDVAFVVGQIATWYGKQTGGLPTAFGCVRDRERQAIVEAASARRGDIEAYLRSLHAHLRLGEVPGFLVTDVFFMAGEGNRHPKHIAYFLPEDEGVKRSPFKKTYYFGNTHRALVAGVSLPLATRFLDLGDPSLVGVAGFEPIPALGVLAHEMGHFVHREDVSFAALNAADRWASVVLQEVAADVFGILIVAEVLAPALSLDPARAIAYHLAECLRYVDRGLGYFPDSDGMLLQLSYLERMGALSLADGPETRLSGDPGAVKAGLRSLARVLADTLLAGDVSRALALHRTYGPASREALAPLLGALRDRPQSSIEYVQEGAGAPASSAADVAA